MNHQKTNQTINNLASLITALCGKDRNKAEEFMITLWAQGVMEIAAEYDDAGHKDIADNAISRLKEILRDSRTGLAIEGIDEEENVITIENFLNK